MSALRRLVGVALSTCALAGCPDPPPPAGPAPLPTHGGDAPVASTAPVAPPAPTPVTVVPPAPPAADERVRLTAGRLLSLSPSVRIGGSGVSRGLAQLDVLIGPYHYAVEAAPGDAIPAGPATVLVDEVDPAGAGAVVVRWRMGGGDEPLEQASRLEGGAFALREMALHRLPGGIRVGVGDVRETAQGAQVVVTVFPAGYAEDPGGGYARRRVAAGAEVAPPRGPRVRIRRIVPRGPGQPRGAVQLEVHG